LLTQTIFFYRVFLYWNQQQVTMFDINQFQSTALFGSVKLLSADVPEEDTDVALGFVLKVRPITGRTAPRWVEFPQAQWDEVDTLAIYAEYWQSNTRSGHDPSSSASAHSSGDESYSLESNEEEEDAVSAWTAAGAAGGTAGGDRV
jgi:hypothetical protein